MPKQSSPKPCLTQSTIPVQQQRRKPPVLPSTLRKLLGGENKQHAHREHLSKYQLGTTQRLTRLSTDCGCHNNQPLRYERTENASITTQKTKREGNEERRLCKTHNPTKGYDTCIILPNLLNRTLGTKTREKNTQPYISHREVERTTPFKPEKTENRSVAPTYIRATRHPC